METTTKALIGMTALAFLALAAFTVYRWRMRERGRGVERWVKDYLARRYGAVPEGLHVNCSDDARWPVLVSFLSADGGTRHSMQFGCWGPVAAFSLLSEKEEKR